MRRARFGASLCRASRHLVNGAGLVLVRHIAQGVDGLRRRARTVLGGGAGLALFRVFLSTPSRRSPTAPPRPHPMNWRPRAFPLFWKRMFLRHAFRRVQRRPNLLTRSCLRLQKAQPRVHEQLLDVCGSEHGCVMCSVVLWAVMTQRVQSPVSRLVAMTRALWRVG